MSGERAAPLAASLALTLAAALPSPDGALAAEPPAPDYARAEAWAAWPGRASGADAVPPGVTGDALPESETADVFFIHPTTYLSGAAANARYDEPGLTSRRIDRGVLRFQASAFNACCRIYAPHYRQAALAAFLRNQDSGATAAYELAYADVRRAFDYYLEHENHGRPFLIAGHSQGALHASRLLQEHIAGRPLEQALVAAYVIGYYVPRDIERTGLPVCGTPEATGCLLDWNTVSRGSTDEGRRATRLTWLDGRYQPIGERAVVCVNPLSWLPDAAAPAALNLGSLPGVASGAELARPVPGLTGAACTGGALHVDIPWSRRLGFADLLTLFGSYHVYDYNLFYLNIRQNAKARVVAYRAAHGGGHPEAQGKP